MVCALKYSPEAQKNYLHELDLKMRREAILQREACEKIWDKPIDERVRDGYALGPLKVAKVSSKVVILSQVDHTADLAECRFREGDLVRLSQDSPRDPIGKFMFMGEDHDGIQLHWQHGSKPAVSDHAWIVDQDHVDLTDLCAKAIEALAASERGRNFILPLLMGNLEATLDAESYEQTLLDLESNSTQRAWHDSQKEAIAACVASDLCYLVQGPPGTGKTLVLSEVVHRLIEKGERVLITGPTHRAINHALGAVRKLLGSTVRVVKIGLPPIEEFSFECHENFLTCGLPECGDPYVVGATPFALWSARSGLVQSEFDTVLFDEASQITPLLAIMAMMRGQRWLFFGDDCQLPPVVLDDASTDRARSIFRQLKNRGFDTLLEESWRLSGPLAEWPSAVFYGNRLKARHALQLLLEPVPTQQALWANPAICLIECSSSGTETVRSNQEAQCVVGLIREAVQLGMMPQQIGVVVPFRAHAARIRQLLGISDSGMQLRRRIVVDTVERFQGQERDLIIVSTAAAHQPFIHQRADFLFQAERWNVSVTRARLKTIVIAAKNLLECADSMTSYHRGAQVFSSLVAHLRHHAR